MQHIDVVSQRGHIEHGLTDERVSDDFHLPVHALHRPHALGNDPCRMFVRESRAKNEGDQDENS